MSIRTSPNRSETSHGSRSEM